MDQSKSRRKWSNGDKDFQMPLSIPVAKEEVPPQYEHYLHLLQERNRLIKKLRQKDRKEIELEKKEKGFTVYLNSSFSADKDSRSKLDSNRQLQRRKTVNATDQIVSSKHTRSKLEPVSQAQDKRRHWNISSVEFTAADGQRHKVKPPEILTGNYQEDFEDEAEFESKMSSLDLNDWDNVDSVNNSSSLSTPRKHKTSYLKRIVAAKREESVTENTVVIKMEDVKKLRESLQKNQSIRQSIAMDSDSNESDGERISPIDEEIEEVLSSDDDNKKAGGGLIKPLKLFKPGDTLVLEFQPLTNKTKTSTNLTAARKKTDTEISSSISSVKSLQLSSSTLIQKSTTPRELTVRSDTSKAIRPLSANRKSADTKTDSQDEAAAVLKAVQEENKKVEKSKSRPLPLPKKSSSLVVLPTTSAQGQMPPLNQSTIHPDKPKDEAEPSIDCVIKKVLQMNPKQQRQLLNTLNHIDTEDQLVSSHCITSSWSSKGPVTERMEVALEILSNWGHSSMVGLTELQFFDQSKCLIPIKPSDVSIHGAKENSNNIEVLFNGKSKTTKERNMWCCRFDGRPIEFSILLINPNPGKNFQLGSVKVWNWNNKINNLDIGARHIRIFFKGDLLFDGEIDKGCGNQVFDYSKQIVFSLAHPTYHSQAGKSPSKSVLSLDLSKSGGNSVLLSKNSPRLTSPAAESPTKTDIYGLNPSGSHHTFRSISRSSQSSASSSGSIKFSGQGDEKAEEGTIRSETRTLLRATVLPGLSSPEIDLADCLAKTSTNLTAARKKADTEISSSISSVKSLQLSSSTLIQKSMTPRELTVRSDTSKAIRPLSANRKSADTKTDSQDEAAAVLKAVQEENKKVEKSKSRPLPLPKKSSSLVVLPTTSAQGQMPPLSQSTIHPDKPKDEAEPSIDCVIKKVLQMNPKQQRQLLNTLNHIDTEDQLVSSHCITSSWSSKGPVTERMEVALEILSNWGHSSMVGLTELQFFDQSKCLIPIKPSDVSIHGAKENSNNIEVLFNGKSKNLDIGARHIRIFFKGDLLFDGEIDKGCGNQVFDYSKQIVFSLAHPTYHSQAGKSPSKSVLSLDLSKSGGNSVLLSKNSPRLTSPAAESPTKTDIYGLNPSGSHHTFRSISRSSQSSASSSGSTKFSGQGEEKAEEGTIRSETRTLLRATVLPGLSSPEIDLADCLGNVKMPEKSRAQTPKKSKRVAANLNGRSNDTDNSYKSNNDSYDSKPPLPPTSKSDDKQSSSSSSRSLERSSNSSTKTKMSPKSSRSEPHISPSTSSPPSTQIKNSIQSDKKDSNLLDSIKTMNQSENKRKKTFPTWLKGDKAVENVIEKSSPYEQSSRGEKHKEEADIQKELDEEFKRFSQSGGKNKEKGNLKAEENDVLSPMKKIEKSRAKWRLKEADLEESWGSLSFFNKSHRGRVSIDMGDNELDEYLKPEVKSSESEAPAAAPKIHLADDSWSDDDTDFTIPELPGGKEMVVNIKTTWGDHHYVGLTGIQLFSSQGEQVVISKIWANPSDINILPEYNRDPRVVNNLIDNVNRTRDDVHMWLAPFTSGKDHFIYLTFSKPCKLALMRIWNYNKSRIHSFRGAKDVIITLDGVTIFKGEIARACGGIEGGTEAFGDTILFTTDDDILEAVSKNDDAFEGEIFSENDEDIPELRPATADAEDETRPFTRAAGQLHKDTNRSTSTPRPASSFVTNIGDVLVYKTKKLQLQFTATWGDYHYLGLTGLELVGSDGEAIPISMDMITASPKDLRHLPGNEKDERTLDKLLDGANVTCHDSHMWLIPFSEGQNHMVTVSFSQPALLSGLRVWNYNKSPEDTYRGAKIMHVYINDKIVSPSEGYLLRKGPGVCHFDFAQEINFSNSSSSNLDNMPAYQINEGGVQMPRGFIFQFQLFNTWGDQYYIGLNGLEFYDASFKKIELTQTNIAAYPDSVNILDNITNDARTPDKLIDGFNDTNDGRHMWLAPILPSIINRIYVIFDQPTSVSMIKLWNYSKTVTRGVKDFALLVDDLLVYNGTLQAISGGAKGIVPNCSAPVPHHTVLFSDNQDVTQKEKHFIISNQTEDQDIQLMNDKKVISRVTNASSNKPVNQALRPKTSVTKTSRSVSSSVIS
ncbi:hypothetical protein Btru_004902, partial [Bulinus truncatus]